MLHDAIVAMARGKVQWRALLLVISCLMAFSPDASPCGSVCIPPHNETATFILTRQAPSGQPFRLAGFGVAIADKDVANCLPGENPGFESATLTWKDFRFYAKIPGFPGSGIVKGTLNKEKNSAVLLTANDFHGNGGLFPASLTNQVFLRLLPVDWPSVEYRNVLPVTIYTPSTPSAPPNSSVITRQQGETVFEIVGTPPPGFPPTVSISGGEQKFLDSVAIGLSLLSTSGGTIDVQLSNPLPQNVLVAYFLHVDDVDPLADRVESLDGVRSVAAGGQTVLSFDVRGIPIGQKTISVDAMVLDPISVAGHDRLTFQLPASAGPSGAGLP